MHLIIDADPIVYRCGFASERTEYHLLVEGENISEMHFAPDDKMSAGDKMKGFFKAYPGYEILDKQRVVYPEPEENALEAVRTQLYSIEKECRRHYGISEFDKISVILSGPGNYRDKLATIFPYKGNRDPEHKPYWYQSIRDYLTGSWGARVVTGREADDECSIIGHSNLSNNHPFIIATIDKDLDQIPGNHYNYLKQVFYAQSADDARHFFWRQCLSGDPTDGVLGCWKIGELRAERIINGLVEAASSADDGEQRADTAVHERASSGDAAGFRVQPSRVLQSADEGDDRPTTGRDRCRTISNALPGISDSDNEGRIWRGIVREYAYSQTRPGCSYVDRDPKAVAVENARLVYLQQVEGELWTPPGEPKQWLPEYEDAK